MQVHTNRAYVRRQGRLGRISSLLGFGFLLAGLILSWNPWQPGEQNELVVVAWATLLPGFLLITYGNYNTIRWGVKPRMDEIVANALKSLDNKHQLFNYVPGLPADNLLLTPSGVVVLVLRPYMGEFVNTGRKWRRNRNLMGWLLALGEGSLGNPTRDAERDVAATRQYLAERLGDEAEQVPVDAVVAFTHPRAKLTTDDPAIPATHARDLKSAIRRPQGRGKLSNQLYFRVSQAFKAAG